MQNKINLATDSDQEQVYQIRVKGHLDQQWTSWFAGMSITQNENGDTLLTGSIVDQSELHGVLKKVRDLGLSLVSVIGVNNRMSDLPDIV